MWIWPSFAQFCHFFASDQFVLVDYPLRPNWDAKLKPFPSVWFSFWLKKPSLSCRPFDTEVRDLMWRELLKQSFGCSFVLRRSFRCPSRDKNYEAFSFGIFALASALGVEINCIHAPLRSNIRWIYVYLHLRDCGPAWMTAMNDRKLGWSDSRRLSRRNFIRCFGHVQNPLLGVGWVIRRSGPPTNQHNERSSVAGKM